jgi:cytoskeletal protein RodZ
MLDEGSNNTNLETPEETPPPEESNNRTFLIVGGIFAGLIFLTLICGAVYALWYLPRTTASQRATQSAIQAGNAQVIQQMTSTAQAALWTPTSPPADTPTDTGVPTNPPANSPTPVIAISTATGTATPTIDPGTLVAMQTQLSSQLTSTAIIALGTPAGAMPQTGFFDQVGLPGLVILTLALVAVIFLARRMRNSPTK